MTNKVAKSFRFALKVLREFYLCSICLHRLIKILLRKRNKATSAPDTTAEQKQNNYSAITNTRLRSTVYAKFKLGLQIKD
jgi:hypothetical protein